MNRKKCFEGKRFKKKGTTKNNSEDLKTEKD